MRKERKQATLDYKYHHRSAQICEKWGGGCRSLLTMIDVYKTILGISAGLVAQNGSINWPSAPPNGLARLAIAVALTRPCPLNHSSEYRVGALKTNGCANPIHNCPNITTPKFCALVPAYLIQFPNRSRPAAMMIDSFGPDLFKV